MFDECVKKLAGFGVPGLVLLLAIDATGLAGAAAITAALAAIGPGGIVGGVATLVLAGLVMESIAEFGVDEIYAAVIKDLYSKGETEESIRSKIQKFWVSPKLKALLLDKLNHFHRD